MLIRTMVEVMEERASYENHKFLEGMPTGPWKSDVDAKMAINEYAHCHGFSVIFRTILLASNQKRGRRRHVCCDRFGFYKHRLHAATIDKQRNKCTKKCGCPWGVWIEEIVDKDKEDVVWVCTVMDRDSYLTAPDFHGSTHVLCKNLSSKNAFSSFRNIPNDLIECCELMSKTMNTKIVHQFLVNTVLSRGGEITFTYMDVFNAFKIKEIEKSLDSTGLVQLLRAKEKENNLKWDIRHDAEGLLNIVVFEVEQGQKTFSNLRNNVSMCV